MPVTQPLQHRLFEQFRLAQLIFPASTQSAVSCICGMGCSESAERLKGELAVIEQQVMSASAHYEMFTSITIHALHIGGAHWQTVSACQLLKSTPSLLP